MNNQYDTISIDDIKAAADRIKTVARRTPLERPRWLSLEMNRWLKLESLQVTGSFKVRGAMSRMSALSGEERSHGILTVSAGNHGQAVAFCAEKLNLDATIIVPRSASRTKVEAIGRYPVRLIERGSGYDEAERAAREMEREGFVFVSPYNDPLVIAGQGTIALEILEENPEIEALVAPVGGGGLLAGLAITAKAINPAIKVYGAEPAASPTMTAALNAGSIIAIEEEGTLADGLAGNIEPGSMTFPIIERLADEIILVSEDAIRQSIRRFAREEHMMIEGAAAVALAALDDPRFAGLKTAAILTGRNITLESFVKAVS